MRDENPVVEAGRAIMTLFMIMVGLTVVFLAAPGLLLFGFLEWCLHWFGIHMNPGQVWSLSGLLALTLAGCLRRRTRSWLTAIRAYSVLSVVCLLVIGLLTSTFRSCREPVHAIIPQEWRESGKPNPGTSAPNTVEEKRENP